MRHLGIATFMTLLLAGCEGGMAGLSDSELQAQHKDCKDLGGSRKIKAMTCDQVRQECERRWQEEHRYVCR